MVVLDCIPLLVPVMMMTMMMMGAVVVVVVVVAVLIIMCKAFLLCLEPQTSL